MAPGAAEPLLSVDALKAKLGEPDLVVVDIRSVMDGGSVETYAKGHIPGAVHSDYDKAGCGVSRATALPFMLPTVPAALRS